MEDEVMNAAKVVRKRTVFYKPAPVTIYDTILDSAGQNDDGMHRRFAALHPCWAKT